MNIFKNFKYWLKDTAFIRYISFLWHWKNFFFLLKYPFWRARNVWTGKFCGYSFTWYDNIPTGWRIAFGKELSEEIKQAGLAFRKRADKYHSWKDMITFEQIKEKYGTLRLYASAVPEIQHVLQKYELLSEFYCINCGKKAEYMTGGWIEYYCNDCFEKECQHYDSATRSYYPFTQEELDKAKEECKLSEDDLPKITRYEDGEAIEVDLKEEYGIDFKKLR